MVRNPENEAWHKGYAKIKGKENILEQGMRGISKLDKMPKEISEVSKQLHSQEFTDQIGKLVGIEGSNIR